MHRLLINIFSIITIIFYKKNFYIYISIFFKRLRNSKFLSFKNNLKKLERMKVEELKELNRNRKSVKKLLKYGRNGKSTTKWKIFLTSQIVYLSTKIYCGGLKGLCNWNWTNYLQSDWKMQTARWWWMNKIRFSFLIICFGIKKKFNVYQNIQSCTTI